MLLDIEFDIVNGRLQIGLTFVKILVCISELFLSCYYISRLRDDMKKHSKNFSKNHSVHLKVFGRNTS